MCGKKIIAQIKEGHDEWIRITTQNNNSHPCTNPIRTCKLVKLLVLQERISCIWKQN